MYQKNKEKCFEKNKTWDFFNLKLFKKKLKFFQ